MKILFIINNKSSKYKESEVIDSLNYLKSQKIDYKIWILNSLKNDCKKLKESSDSKLYYNIEDIKNSSYDITIIQGGDGSINRIVNELYKKSFESKYIAIVPFGNINILAKYLHIKKNTNYIKKIIDSYKEDRYVTISPPKINGRCLMCVASMGADANIVASIEHDRINGLNMDIRIAYLFNIIKTLSADVYSQNIKRFNTEISINRDSNEEINNYKNYTIFVLNIPVITYLNKTPISYRDSNKLFNGFDVLLVQEKNPFNILNDLFLNPHYYKVGKNKYLNTSFFLFKGIFYARLKTSLLIHCQVDGEDIGIGNHWIVEEMGDFAVKILFY